MRIWIAAMLLGVLSALAVGVASADAGECVRVYEGGNWGCLSDRYTVGTDAYYQWQRDTREQALGESSSVHTINIFTDWPWRGWTGPREEELYWAPSPV